MKFLLFRCRQVRKDRTSFFMTLPHEYTKSIELKHKDLLDIALHLDSGLLIMYPRHKIEGGYNAQRLFNEFLEWKEQQDNAADKETSHNNTENNVSTLGKVWGDDNS